MISVGHFIRLKWVNIKSSSIFKTCVKLKPIMFTLGPTLPIRALTEELDSTEDTNVNVETFQTLVGYKKGSDKQ